MQRIRYMCQSRFGTYYYRYSLPTWYIHKFPKAKKQIFISLMTKDADLAKLRIMSLTLRTQQALNRIKNMNLLVSMDKEKSISQLLYDFEKYITNADLCEQEMFRHELADFEMASQFYTVQLATIKKAGLLKFVREDFSNIIQLEKKATEFNKKKEEAEINAVLQNQFLDITSQKKNTETEPDNTETVSPRTGILLSEVLQKYLKNEMSDVRQKTQDKMTSHIEFLIHSIGDININDFTQAHLREYQKKLNEKTKITDGKSKSISSVTKNDHLASCKKLFEFAIGFYNSELENYFSNSTIHFKVKKKQRKIRVPFSTEELLKIFSHKIFMEGKYKYPYQYWAPLLALFTGSRENEIAQLRDIDIIIVDGIHCISHNLSTPDKMLKGDKEKLIPLHPKLIELGFLDFVELFKNSRYQWEKSYSSHRLFKGLTLDKVRGGYQKNLSRWFNGMYDKRKKRHTGFKYEVDISFPDNEMKDFHSFRHTFATAMDEAGIPPHISYMITGHTYDSETIKMNNSAGSRYRHGVSERKKYEEICKLDFDDILVNVKPFFDVNGEKKCRNQRGKK